LSLADPLPAGLRLRKAFNHFVFIDVVEAADILRSPGFGEPGSNLAKKSSFCNEKKRHRNMNNKKVKGDFAC
jgi:hypothetical protein